MVGPERVWEPSEVMHFYMDDSRDASVVATPTTVTSLSEASEPSRAGGIDWRLVQELPTTSPLLSAASAPSEAEGRVVHEFPPTLSSPSDCPVTALSPSAAPEASQGGGGLAQELPTTFSSSPPGQGKSCPWSTRPPRHS